MASNRHFARILLMQALYEWQQRDDEDLAKIIERHLGRHEFEENNLKFIHKAVAGLKRHMEEIDAIITAGSRMAHPSDRSGRLKHLAISYF